jgi:acetyltransferase-like isoleucine patch superfamily enzyme
MVTMWIIKKIKNKIAFSAQKILLKLKLLIPILKIIEETKCSQTPVTLNIWFYQKVLGINKYAYWPIHFTSRVGCFQNVYAGIDVSPGWSPGCYIQGGGKTYIGDYTQIAPNVGIISANHELYDSRKSVVKDVHIGKYCWIGMGAIILPGVNLGDFTIVGAGSIVTKSFPDGYCVIAGNPAKLIKLIDQEMCVPFKNLYEYNGYIPSGQFEAFRKKHLFV